MIRLAALLLALAAIDEGRAATAYVTDELVLGVYATQNTQGERLATLHSGAAVETLAVNGEATRVRLADGTAGWVKTAYLTNDEPATVRIKQLQDELDRHRATAPLPQAAKAPAPWLWGLTLLVALGGGYWWGYATLARRIRHQFGGIKVY